MNIYESEKLESEYLLFHYGTPDEILPYHFGPKEALEFPVRCVERTFDFSRLPRGGRALDVGCAVGRSTFELARHFASVTGIDYSHRFVQVASELASRGERKYQAHEEGARFSPHTAQVPSEIDRSRVHFEQGDATALRADLGSFDALVAANLLCRLPDPRRFLRRTAELVRRGGQLVLTTPCTWLEEFTPRDNWLCTETQSTFDGVTEELGADFRCDRVFDLPMLIREHSRKFQWTVTQASCWTRNG